MASQASTGKPELPAEIHRMILTYYTNDHNDLIHLWTACRRVSARFRYIVDDMFKTRILPSTELYFHRYLFDDEIVCHDTAFGFLHLSGGGQRAIYGHGLPTGDDLLQKLATNEGTRVMLEEPFHTVRIAQRTTDVHLPNLGVDTNLGTIALDWRELFSIFFAEEKLSQTLFEQTAVIPHSSNVLPQPHSSVRLRQFLDDTIISPSHRKLPHVLQFQPLLERMLSEHRHRRSACLPHFKPLSRTGHAKRAARRVRLAHFTPLLLPGRSLTIDEDYRIQEAHIMSDLYDYQLQIENSGSRWLWRGEGDGRYFVSVNSRGNQGGGCFQKVWREWRLDTGREGSWFADVY